MVYYNASDSDFTNLIMVILCCMAIFSAYVAIVTGSTYSEMALQIKHGVIIEAEVNRKMIIYYWCTVMFTILGYILLIISKIKMKKVRNIEKKEVVENRDNAWDFERITKELIVQRENFNK